MAAFMNLVQRLRWRLTLSYTAVTIGALIVAELVLVAFLFGGVQYVRQSNFIPAALIRYMRSQAVQQVEGYLEDDEPDMEGLEMWVGRFTGTLAFEGQNPVETTTTPLPWQVLVVDDESMLLAVSSFGEIESPVGETFDGTTITGLAGPLQSALQGDDDVDELSTVRPETNTVIVAVPIRDESGNVIGAVAAIAAFPLGFQAYIRPTIVASLLSMMCFGLPVALVGTLFGFLTARNLVRRLEGLSMATVAWSQGDFSKIVIDDTRDELGELTRRMNLMAEQLQYLIDTRQEFATVEERNRIARDLHDSAKQQAYAAAAQLGAARSLYDLNREAAEGHLSEAEHLIDELRKELTGVIRKLRPVALQGKGLAPSLQEYAADWSRQTGIQVDIRLRGERVVPYEIERTMFRIAHEAFANIHRHSEASQVVVTLVYTNSSVTLNIADDGKGFDPNTTKSGVGLRSMRERAGLMGGTFTVRSAPGKGTLISVKCPLQSLEW